MIWKNYFIVCIHKRVKSIIFTVSVKFCDASDLAILWFQGAVNIKFQG